MRCAIILTVISVALAASVPAPAQQRIVGGRPTTVDKYPFAGNTQISENGIVWLSQCGGTLISTTAVLSAAHCFDFGFPARYYGVRLGSSYPSSGGTVFNLASYVNHPEYNTPYHANDVTILKLATPVVFDDLKRNARIPAPVFPIADGAELTVIGWGSLYTDGPAPEILQEVQLNKVDTKICAERYRTLNAELLPYPDVIDTMLCSGIDAGGKSSCHGDSGGPVLLNEDIVVGIVSWSHQNCGEPMYPGVNTLVSAFSDWIVANA
ncbi:trypsin CFT-1-like [Plutella xylostella]|uniref:trypsin CFT-1-like n=1 Tax=Plutella xylostella TaxID=51655 RepID=UPI002032C281|nr:trypsin CFT-1-like [Plutella xylostella]